MKDSNIPEILSDATDHGGDATAHGNAEVNADEAARDDDAVACGYEAARDNDAAACGYEAARDSNLSACGGMLTGGDATLRGDDVMSGDNVTALEAATRMFDADEMEAIGRAAREATAEADAFSDKEDAAFSDGNDLFSDGGDAFSDAPAEDGGFSDLPAGGDELFDEPGTDDTLANIPAVRGAEPPYRGAPTEVPRPKRRKKRSWALRILLAFGKTLLALVLIAAIAVGGLVGYLTVTEYYPAYAESALRGSVSSNNKLSDKTLRLLTFNTGYAGLGEDADFFMDGGQGVNPESEALTEENAAGIVDILRDIDADVILLQEVDRDSDRTFHRNQWMEYEAALGDYESRYALNYSCKFVPYPLDEMMGEVNSGIATFSRYDIGSATRYSLPCPFEWPTRVANLKRCLLVTRIPIANSEQELVIVNLHLEAYDDGEGKAAQTEQLLSLLEEEYAKGNYVIAGGDFNQSFPNTLSQYPVLETSTWQPGVLEALGEDWQYAFDAASPTCRLLDKPYDPAARDNQYYVIDGYIVSPNVQVDKVETLDEGFVYSDHNPVLLEVTLLD